ncbi:MAG: DUF438 domain-containing protein [Pseudomonadota bacterium]
MSEALQDKKQKIATLASVIRGLHEGESPDSVKQRLKQLVQSTTSDEVVAMEQALMDDGMSVDEVRRMCDLHSQVLREVLDGDPLGSITPGHPIDVFRQENQALRVETAALRRLAQAIRTPALPSLPAEVLGSLRSCVDRLIEVEKHYARKENLVFPLLEHKGISGPSQVMWAKDDEVRELLKALREAVAEDASALDMEGWRSVVDHLARPLADAVDEMMVKEEKVFLPTALEKLNAEDWAQVTAEGHRFGYCLITPPATTDSASTPDQSTTTDRGGTVRFSAGALSPEQLRGLMTVLPLDLTFVDADDRVAFFTEGQRIFPRPSTVIGRQVQLCHPPRSMHIVQKILDDFRAGSHDQAEFWIQMHGRFVHIRYLAVRGDQDQYLGCLELTQDLTTQRALQGEQRLLSYGSQEKAAENPS